MPRDLEEWLKKPPRHLTWTEFLRLGDKDRQLLLNAYKENSRKVAEKWCREERRKKESRDKYLQKLRKKEPTKRNSEQ